MNTTQTISLRHCAFGAIAALVLAIAPVQAQTMKSPPSHPTDHAQGAMQKGDDMKAGSSQGSTEMGQAMNNGMQAMQQMKMSGDVDKDFATMMKMHHQQALDMAKVEINHGKSAQLKAMAKKMIKDQSREIEQLDQWLKQHP